MTELSRIYPEFEEEIEKSAAILRGSRKQVKTALDDHIVHSGNWSKMLNHARKEGRRIGGDTGKRINDAADRGVPLGTMAMTMRTSKVPGVKEAMGQSDRIALATKGGLGDASVLAGGSIGRKGSFGDKLEGVMRDPVGSVKSVAGKPKKKLKERRRRRGSEKALVDMGRALDNTVAGDPRRGLTGRERQQVFQRAVGLTKSDDGWKWRGPVGDDAGERRFKRKETWPSRGKGVKRQLKPKKSGHAVRQYTPNRVP